MKPLVQFVHRETGSPVWVDADLVATVMPFSDGATVLEIETLGSMVIEGFAEEVVEKLRVADEYPSHVIDVGAVRKRWAERTRIPVQLIIDKETATGRSAGPEPDE